MTPAMTGRSVFLTRHAAQRISQRGISLTSVDLTLKHGARIQQDGATLYFLGRRHLPPDVAPAESRRFEGTAVVVSRDGTLLTAYRIGRIPRRLRRRNCARRCVG